MGGEGEGGVCMDDEERVRVRVSIPEQSIVWPLKQKWVQDFNALAKDT